MEFRILGPIEALSGGEPLQLGGVRQRALLAYFLLHIDEVVSADRLLDQLWIEPPGGGVAAVQTQVSRLRKVLGDRIATSGRGYELHLEPGELDLARFQSLLAAAGIEADPARRSALLREADALWHGEALAGIDAPFVAAEAAALEELRLAAMEDRLEADLARGLDGELVAELSALVVRHPLRERLRGQLILALYRSDRQADALEAYRETRRLLDEELGLEPGPALRELERAILRHDPVLKPVVTSIPDTEAVTRTSGRRGRLRAALAVGALAAVGATGALAVMLTDTDHATRSAPRSRTPAGATSQSTEHPVVVKRRTPSPKAHRPIKRNHGVKRRSSLRKAKPVVDTVTRPTTRNSALATTTAASPRPQTTTTRKPAKPLPKTVRILDEFDGNQIDGTIWYQIYQGSGWSLSQNGGHLEFAFSPAASPGGQYNVFGGHVGTHCKFPGDFDARVDFTLAQWPASNGVRIVLWSFFGPTNIGWQVWRWSGPQAGESYGSYTGTGQNASVSLADTTGSLRIARNNGVVTTYFFHNGRWQMLTSGRMSELATIAVGADGGPGDNSPFGGDEVVADFDNFSVNGVDPVCPAGSRPPSR